MVVLAVLIGSGLLGVVGALLALPLAGAIAAAARVWQADPPAAPTIPPTDVARTKAPGGERHRSRSGRVANGVPS